MRRAADLSGNLAAAADAALSGHQAVLAANAGAVESVLLACRAGVAATRGEFEAAERLGRDALLLEEASSFRMGAHLACPVLAYTRAVAGDRSGATAALARWARGAGPSITSQYEVMLRLGAGDVEGAAALRERDPGRAARRWDPSLMDLGHLAVAAEIATPLGGADLRTYYCDAINDVLARGVRWPAGWPSFLPRVHGSLALAMGELDLAAESLAQALDVATSEGALPERAHSHLAQARLLIARGASADRRRLEEHLAEAIRGFAALGMQPDVDRAVAVAEQLSAAVPPISTPAPSRPAGLTPRQIEILRAISHGKTNAEIADELVLSIATVKRHIANIFNRLGITNRAAAATFAVQHRLDE